MTTTRTRRSRSGRGTYRPAAHDRPARRWDWSLRPRGPVSAAGMGALGLAAAAVAGGELAELSPLYAAGAGMVGVACTVVAGGGLHPRNLWYRVGVWAGASGWLTWAMAAGLAQVPPWPVLGLGALAAGLLGPWATAAGTHLPGPAAAAAAEREQTAHLPRQHTETAAEWTARIRRCGGGLRVTITEVRPWEHGTGFSALLLLPPGGKTVSHLDTLRDGLAADAQLPEGCGVEFTPGPNRGAAWMHVATVNRLAQTIDHPGGLAWRSITQPVAIGEFRDGSTVTLHLREPSTLLVGQKRSGKTVTLHDLTRATGLCVDNLDWHMDLNGGGVSQAWLAPWLAGQTDRPAIDWAAPCAEEALLMAEAHRNIAIARKTDYAQLKLQADVQLLPVSADVPQVTVLMDEGRELLSPQIKDPIVKAARDRIEETQRVGGNEACALVLSVLRCISTTVDTDVLKQCANRLIMFVSDTSEIQYLFDYPKGVSPADLSGQGSGFVRAWPDNLTVRPWKAWMMQPRRDIFPAAVEIATHRPDLDAPGARAAGTAYRTRYERMRWLFSTPEQRTRLPKPSPIELPGVRDDRNRPIIWDPALTHPAAGDHGNELATTAEPRPPASRTTSGGDLLHAVTGGTAGMTAGWGDAEAIAAAAAAEHAAARPIAPATPAAADGGRLHAEQVHQVGQAPAAEVPTLLRCALLAFDQVRGVRMHSEELAAALGIIGDDGRGDPLALAALLRPLGVTTLPNKFMRGGREARGYALDALEAAAARIAAGGLAVPAEIAAWPDRPTAA
ncbi:hypothetical protein [Spongiactinospora sp. 9N601]|uniref:hypothetical protein n=1 Tax=Spongiactinospora sp. 9N601 TaxID=3375149 RepID=UPI003791E3EA